VTIFYALIANRRVFQGTRKVYIQGNDILMPFLKFCLTFLTGESSLVSAA
jgi:hypothetical protein